MTRAVGLRPVLLAQASFMVGFASVVPFIAAIAAERYALGAAAVAAIVGVRVAAQQGLFVVGGWLTDRFGARPLLVVGCGIRAAGFALVSLGDDTSAFVAGVVLIGMGGAGFSPAIDALVGRIDVDRRHAGHRRGPAPFAALMIAGEAGGLAGALVGAWLMPQYASSVALAAAGVFAVAMVALALVVPSGVSSVRSSAPASARPLPATLPTPVLIAAGAVLLATWTQLFSLAPLGFAAHGIDPSAIGWIAVALSLCTLVLQWPLSRLAERLGRERALAAGLALGVLAAALASVAQAAFPTLPVMVLVAVLIACGSMLGTPSVQSLVAGSGSDSRRATRLGLLASVGGALTLAVTTLTGALSSLSLPAAWLAAGALPAAAVILLIAAGARTPLTAPVTSRKEHV